MLTIKEAKKIPFEQLDDATKEFLYDLFKRYVVRKKIADTNKTLSSMFSRKFGPNPRDYARCFNDFNSCFVSSDLIRNLTYDEIHTNFLKKMTEDQFNSFLERTGNSFDRKIALMCFSGRPSERIANRVTFPVMLAYANMQELVIEKMKELIKEKYPNIKLLKAQDGYVKDREKIKKDIIKKQPDLCLVALGIPNQEKFIYDMINEVNKGIFMGVGGTFDVLSGSKKRAPKIFIKLNLEWLYRIACEPKRLKRFFDSNIKFMLQVYFKKWFYHFFYLNFIYFI